MSKPYPQEILDDLYHAIRSLESALAGIEHAADGGVEIQDEQRLNLMHTQLTNQFDALVDLYRAGGGEFPKLNELGRAATGRTSSCESDEP